MRRVFFGAIGVFVVCIMGLGACASITRSAHQPAYDLQFVIDGNFYVTDTNLSGDDCLRVLQSVAHDPDSFRHGAGVYTCVAHSRKVNKK